MEVKIIRGITVFSAGLGTGAVLQAVATGQISTFISYGVSLAAALVFVSVGAWTILKSP